MGQKTLFDKVSPMTVAMIVEDSGLPQSKIKDMVHDMDKEYNHPTNIINNGGLINLLTKSPNERFCDRAISDIQFNAELMEQTCVKILNEREHSGFKLK